MTGIVRVMTMFRLRAILATMMALLALAGAMPACAAPVDPATARYEAIVAQANAQMLVDPAKTIQSAAAARVAAQALSGRQKIIGTATAEWLQGEAYLRLNNVAHAGPLIDHALAAVAHAGPPTKLNGDLLMSRGGYHTATANVAAALADYQAAHNIFRDIGDTRSRALALLNIALLYQEAADYQNALKHYAQALDVYQADPKILYIIYNNRGNALKDLNRLAEADQQYRKALDIARSLKSSSQEARVLRNIARGQIQAGDLDAADRTIAQGFAAARGDEEAETRKQFWVLSAQAAMKRGHLADAVRLIDNVFAGVDTTKTTLDLREGHQAAFDIYKKAGDEPKALLHLEAMKRLDDKTSKLAASSNTALAAARFDFANQELKITTLQRDDAKRTIEFERARARTLQFIFIGAGVVTVIIVSMLGFGLVTIRRSRNEVRAANIDLASTNTALAKALAAKTEFLATTSHEIRTPLNGILGMTQVMLADRDLGDVTRDRIGVVHGAGMTMRALVDDILDVAKMETGHLTVEAVPFDLKATLRDVSRLWEEQARGKGIGFALDLDACPDYVCGDPARLRQIAFNLLSNALKFTEQGSVTLRAATVESVHGPLLTIAVRDTGIGIAGDKHDLIFESFRQADGGTTRKFGGTGLGLSICRNLARAMDGEVSIESEEGQGATFTLSLPLVRAEAPKAASKPAADGGGAALLILDRNPITRAMLRTMLEPRAGSVVLVSTVDEAVERVSQGGIATLLIDDATIKGLDNAPRAVGVLAAAARESGARTVLLWAGLNEMDRAALTEKGADLVIAKPIAGPALGAALFPDVNCDGSTPNNLVTQAA